MTGVLVGNGNYRAQPLRLTVNLILYLPQCFLVFLSIKNCPQFCALILPVFLTFILFPVEAGLVNVSKIMGKLKKTHVIKGAAAALCSTLSVIWLVPILKNTSDNAGCQLLCKTAKLETLCGTLQKMANALCLVSLKVNGIYLCNNTWVGCSWTVLHQ